MLTKNFNAVFLERSVVRHRHASIAMAVEWRGPGSGCAEEFSDPQIVHWGMEMMHTANGTVPQVANPVKFSITPVQHHRASSMLGEHPKAVLRERLSLSNEQLAKLRQDRVI
jgi:crotonobetainyl-CoA:carnitine CoA-transferase CaiB-like acyl-CoA transferase